MRSKIMSLALLLALVSCGEKQGMPEANNEYAVITVQATDAQLETSYPATIKGLEDIEIRPKVSGFITKLCVDEGDFVRKGQPLFQLERVQFEAAVRSAEANVNVIKTNIKTQELNLENKRMLHGKGIISNFDLQSAENQLESLKAQLAQAQAGLTDARNNLSYCTVTSPVSGVVGSIPYRLGSLVSASTPQPLTTVSNIETMYAYFSMTEKQMLALTREKGGIAAAMDKMPAVKLQLADGSEYPLAGNVSAISGVIEAGTGSVQMRATFANPERVLRSGGAGAILVPVKSEGCILVPQKATYGIQNKKFVYVVGDDNKVTGREIEVLVQNDGQNYIVVKGLKAGERIVVEGVNQLKTGNVIKPITPAQAEANRKKAEQALKDGKMPGEN
ncbi:MAG: efflux RND transporter periplasmic adaptor subunit [Bacteroidaceae bacterium]|nr:efflux RND transporter periplasmic adaptor subunit [Bacteroidaceae bacterium]